MILNHQIRLFSQKAVDNILLTTINLTSQGLPNASRVREGGFYITQNYF